LTNWSFHSEVCFTVSDIRVDLPPIVGDGLSQKCYEETAAVEFKLHYPSAGSLIRQINAACLFPQGLSRELPRQRACVTEM